MVVMKPFLSRQMVQVFYRQKYAGAWPTTVYLHWSSAGVPLPKAG
jgi:hypothetical protein